MFEPTDEERRTVRALSGYGVPQEGIAIHIGIDAKTLRKHFRDELDRGSVEATAKVAQTLFHLATVEKNVACVIFWMKARAGWRETVRQENTGPDGKPVAITHVYRLAKEGPQIRLISGDEEPDEADQ
jgi:hypothetical protein